MKPRAKRVIYLLLTAVVGMTAIALSLAWHYSGKIVNKSILGNSSCAAPCWQGIVPGSRMSADEVVRILKALPNTRYVAVYSMPDGTSIRWRWKQWPWRKTGYNSVFLIGGVVYDIALSIEFELTIEEILDAYGIPEAINAGQAGVPEHQYVRMNLFYPTRGLSFAARVLPFDEPVLEPTTMVIESVYTVPEASLESWRQSTGVGGLQAWPGYGKLELTRP